MESRYVYVMTERRSVSRSYTDFRKWDSKHGESVEHRCLRPSLVKLRIYSSLHVIVNKVPADEIFVA